MTRVARHVIVTGGSSGIGEALAKRYIARGDRVSILARSASGLAAAHDRLSVGTVDGAKRIQALHADVCDASELAAAFAQSQSAFGPCDRLITSAGMVRPGGFEELSDEHFRQQMEVNFFGTVNAVRCVYGGMRDRGEGRILMISSGAALIGIHGYTAYSASKSALVGFAESLRAEAWSFRVGISICFPPDTDTPQLAEERTLKTKEAAALSRLGGLWTADAVAQRTISLFERGRFNIFLGSGITALGFFGGVIRPALRRLGPWA